MLQKIGKVQLSALFPNPQMKFFIPKIFQQVKYYVGFI